MSVPILPNTAHPVSRPPMRPPKPLPWEDCYISIFVSFEGRVAVKVVENGSPYLLTPKERVRLDRLMSDDRKRRIKLYQVDHPGERPPPLLPPLQKDKPELSSSIISGSTSSFGGWLRTRKAQIFNKRDKSDPAFDEELIQSLMLCGDVVVNETTPVITCSYDLSTVDTLNDPKDFYEEVAVLNKCVKSCCNAHQYAHGNWHRIRAGYRTRQLERIAEARRLDDAHFGNEVKEITSELVLQSGHAEKPPNCSHFGRVWRKARGKVVFSCHEMTLLIRTILLRNCSYGPYSHVEETRGFQKMQLKDMNCQGRYY